MAASSSGLGALRDRATRVRMPAFGHLDDFESQAGPVLMHKATKHCTLTIHLKAGRSLTGEFHVPASTSSTIRPSDAINDGVRTFIVLSDATLNEGDQPRSIGSVMVPTDAIAFIELPSHWQ